MDITALNFDILCQERLKKYLSLAKPYYRDDPKYYHTFDHIKDCFLKFIQNEEMFDEQYSDHDTRFDYNKDLLFWSIAFHDAFYMPGLQANEELSFEIYSAVMIQNSMVCDTHVYNIILSTKFSKFLDYKLASEKIMHDLDYSCFISAEELEKAEKKIYNEFVGILQLEDNEIQRNFFKAKRIEFYKNLLEKLKENKIYGDLFYTAPFSKYNKYVKSNIQERIEALNHFE